MSTTSNSKSSWISSYGLTKTKKNKVCFLTLRKISSCLTAWKQQKVGGFFTMIQEESIPTMNIKVEEHHISFPKWPGSSQNSTWARSYAFKNMACNTDLAKDSFGSILANCHLGIVCYTRIRCNASSNCQKGVRIIALLSLSMCNWWIKVRSQICQIAFMWNSGLWLKLSPRVKYYPKALKFRWQSNMVSTQVIIA